MRGSPRKAFIGRFAIASAILACIFLGVACDGAASCPNPPCDPASDGEPFDVLRWCEESGKCLRDDTRVPVCSDANASPPPACALGPVDAGETLTFPVGQLWSTLGGRHDLDVVYASCDTDSQPPDFQDVQIRFDGVPAECTSANPCDPNGTPTVTTCQGVPSTVSSITFAFVYGGAQGMTSLQVKMQDTHCSYFCS